MRQIGTLPDAQGARAIANYLASLSIEARLVQSPGGWELWVCDEDKVPRAREEYQAFLSNPADERFRRAEGARSAEVPKEQPAPRPARRPAAEPHRSLTVFLITASIVITVLYHAPQERDAVYKYLFITQIERVSDTKVEWQGKPELPQLRRGELWRLVTPVFIHFNEVHILFNMLWLFSLGGQLERRYGSARLALLVVLIAVPSNLCQYFFSTIVLEGWRPVVTQSLPYFGGMSGVVFGLFGFVWMKAVYERGCGLYVSPGIVLLMMLSLILCMTGAVGPIANMAHLVGLAVGMLSGYVSAWWNSFGSPSIPPEPQE